MTSYLDQDHAETYTDRHIPWVPIQLWDRTLLKSTKNEFIAGWSNLSKIRRAMNKPSRTMPSSEMTCSCLNNETAFTSAAKSTRICRDAPAFSVLHATLSDCDVMLSSVEACTRIPEIATFLLLERVEMKKSRKVHRRPNKSSQTAWDISRARYQIDLSWFPRVAKNNDIRRRSWFCERKTTRRGRVEPDVIRMNCKQLDPTHYFLTQTPDRKMEPVTSLIRWKYNY